MEDVFYTNSLLNVETDLLWLEQTLHSRGKRISKTNNYSVEKIGNTLLGNNIREKQKSFQCGSKNHDLTYSRETI